MCHHNFQSFPCNQCYSYTPPYVRSCDTPCNDSGCPIQLDSNCVIYHKGNNIISGLVTLGLQNGATAQLIFDAIDSQLAFIQAQNYTLTCLRTTYSYVINTLPQFATAVDTTLCVLNGLVQTALTNSAVPITPVDSDSIDLSVSGTNNHTIEANIIISPDSGNQFTVLANGAFVPAQTLAVDYDLNTLTISDGNTVDLTPLFCTPSGWLGNVTADPSAAIDGNYWFRTDLSAAAGLKIRLNGAVRTITTS